MAANMKARAALVLGLLAGSFALPAIPAAAQAQYFVTSTDDQVDATLGDGMCRTAIGTCTLRAAVMEANAHPGQPAAIVLPAGRYELAIPPDQPTSLLSYWPGRAA